MDWNDSETLHLEQVTAVQKASGNPNQGKTLCKPEAQEQRELTSALFAHCTGELQQPVTWFLLQQKHMALPFLSNRQVPFFPIVAQAGSARLTVSFIALPISYQPAEDSLKWMLSLFTPSQRLPEVQFLLGTRKGTHHLHAHHPLSRSNLWQPVAMLRLPSS